MRVSCCRFCKFVSGGADRGFEYRLVANCVYIYMWLSCNQVFCIRKLYDREILVKWIFILWGISCTLSINWVSDLSCMSSAKLMKSSGGSPSPRFLLVKTPCKSWRPPHAVRTLDPPLKSTYFNEGPLAVRNWSDLEDYPNSRQGNSYLTDSQLNTPD